MPAPPNNQYAKGHGKGAPSKYKEEYLDEITDYVKECAEKYKQDKEVELPTREGLANRLGVVVKTLTNWGERNEDFLLALEKLDGFQKNELINKGLAGLYNATITKLLLSSNHGMAEQTKTDVTTKGEKIQSEGFFIEDDEVRKKIKEGLRKNIHDRADKEI